MVTRDSGGRIRSVHVFKEKCCFLAAGECFEILKVVKVACHEGWKEVFFESDAKIMIKNLTKEKSTIAHWSFSNFIISIKSYCLCLMFSILLGPLELPNL